MVKIMFSSFPLLVLWLIPLLLCDSVATGSLYLHTLLALLHHFLCSSTQDFFYRMEHKTVPWQFTSQSQPNTINHGNYRCCRFRSTFEAGCIVTVRLQPGALCQVTLNVSGSWSSKTSLLSHLPSLVLHWAFYRHDALICELFHCML